MTRVRKLFLFGCLPLLAAVGITGAALYRMATWTPPRVVRAAPPPPPEVQEEAQEQVQQIEDVAERAEHEEEPQEFHLDLNEQQANALLITQPDVRKALRGTGLQDPEVEFDDGLVTLSGYIDLRGRDVFLSVTGAVDLNPEGQLQVDLRTVRLGELPAPPALRRIVGEKINAALRSANGRGGPRLQRLAILPGALKVEGTLPPGRRRDDTREDEER